MEFWNGYGVRIEWFISHDGTSALGVVGATALGDDVQIMALDDHGDGDIVVSCTDAVEFSTGGPEI